MGAEFSKLVNNDHTLMSLVKSQGNLHPAIGCERTAQPKAGMDNWYLPGMLARTCQPNPLEAEVGGLL